MDGCFQFCPRGWQAGQVSSLGFPFQICAVRGKGKDCGGQNNSCQDIYLHYHPWTLRL